MAHTVTVDTDDDSDAISLVLRVGYKGSAYSGFAAQPSQAHVHTVAGELSRALEILLRRTPELSCAGRTDAGVHARAQYVSCPVSSQEAETIRTQPFLRSCQALLPPDIRVWQIFRAPASFSARFDACARHYRYRLVCAAEEPLFCADWVWWVREIHELDVASMQRGADYLVGEHDFKSFCKAQSAQGKPTRRLIESAVFSEEESLGEHLLNFDIVGSSFLHSMVRTIMGCLVEVGKGNREPAWIQDVICAQDRCAAGQCAPAKGLTFWDVRYPAGILQAW